MKKLDTAVIFAGGKSVRMGENKALLPFCNHSSLAGYQYNRLSKIFNQVYISTKSNNFNFNPKIVKDRYEVYSPLVALLSIFESLNREEIFILAVDMPFVNEMIIKTLYGVLTSQDDIAVAISPKGIEPLCGVYRSQRVIMEAKRILKQNNHRVTTLLYNSNTKYVRFKSENDFLNLNTPSDYQKAIRLVSM